MIDDINSRITRYLIYKGREAISGEEKDRLIDDAVKGLQKQMPKKPIEEIADITRHINMGNKPHKWKKFKQKYYVCPVCKEPILDYEKYCYECGQAIDWNEEEEE